MKYVYITIILLLLAGQAYASPDCEEFTCESGNKVVGLVTGESGATCSCQAEAEAMTEQYPEVPDMADFGGE